MYEYFTVLLKENDTSNLKLLNDKLSEGFRLDDRIEVGRSTVLTLRKIKERETDIAMNNYDTQTEPASRGIISSGALRGY